MVITVDGLGVNGKTTLAKRIAKHYNLKWLGTGIIYRIITLLIIENNIDYDDEESITKLLNNLDINVSGDSIFLDDKDVTDRIHMQDISVLSTDLARKPFIKNCIYVFQKNFVNKYDSIIEGRDCGTIAAPNANVKFLLYASLEERAKRLSKSLNISFEEAKESLIKRDELDLNGNFIKPENAFEIDTTNYTLDQVYEIMVQIIDKAMI